MGEITDRETKPNTMTEPLRTAHTNDEAIEIARRWMTDNYGVPRELSAVERDSYHEKLGLLVDFLGTLCPKEHLTPGTK